MPAMGGYDNVFVYKAAQIEGFSQYLHELAGKTTAPSDLSVTSFAPRVDRGYPELSEGPAISARLVTRSGHEIPISVDPPPISNDSDTVEICGKVSRAALGMLSLFLRAQGEPGAEELVRYRERRTTAVGFNIHETAPSSGWEPLPQFALETSKGEVSGE
jgi:hypothetical protein